MSYYRLTHDFCSPEVCRAGGIRQTGTGAESLGTEHLVGIQMAHR